MKNRPVKDEDVIDLAPGKDGTYSVEVRQTPKSKDIKIFQGNVDTSYGGYQHLTNRKLAAFIQIMHGFSIGMGAIENLMRSLQGDKFEP
jgi:hypothetical protein